MKADVLTLIIFATWMYFLMNSTETILSLNADDDNKEIVSQLDTT